MLWAKLLVLAGLVLPVTLLAALAEFFVATAIQSARGGSAISLTDPGVLRTVIGASLYLAVTAVIGLALGALLRKTAVGVSVFAGLFFVAPIIVAQLPHSITRIAPYLPVQRRRVCVGPAAGRASAEPVGRVRRALRLRGGADRPGRLAAAAPRRVNREDAILLEAGWGPGERDRRVPGSPASAAPPGTTSARWPPFLMLAANATGSGAWPA